jgi:hypothetical protein
MAKGFLTFRRVTFPNFLPPTGSNLKDGDGWGGLVGHDVLDFGRSVELTRGARGHPQDG